MTEAGSAAASLQPRPNSRLSLRFDEVVGGGFLARIPAMTSLASISTYVQVDIRSAVAERGCDERPWSGTECAVPRREENWFLTVDRKTKERAGNLH